MDHSAPSRTPTSGNTQPNSKEAKTYSTRFKQLVQLAERGASRTDHGIAHDRVARGVAPIHVGSAALLKVIENTPWVVDVDRTEAIAVVPAASLVHATRMAQVDRQGRHLGIGKPVPFVKLHRERCANSHVVEVRENRLLRDALHAGQAGKGQRGPAVFERTGEPSLEEVDDLAVVAVGIARHDRGVVLVNKQNNLPAMVLVQQAAQDGQGVTVVAVGGSALAHGGKEPSLDLVQCRRLGKIRMAPGLLLQSRCGLPHRPSPSRASSPCWSSP